MSRRIHAEPRRPLARAALISFFTLAAGCSDDVVTGGEPHTSSQRIQWLTEGNIDKMDILLTIDNSRSMADKQQILALAVPELLARFVNPPCIDASGAPASMQPASPLDPCPAGTEREQDPIHDIHIGVISTSLGGHGSDSCPDPDPNSKECAPAANPGNDDEGHLLTRGDACGATSSPTYQGKGFLAWDPLQKLLPPGEDVLDDGMNEGLLPALRDMVEGVGQIGCGYESQLESWYRFLVDPEPYQTITVIDGKATPMGLDEALLAQRAEFLRPDSLVVVALLSDENDCSTKEYGQYYYVNQLRTGATNVRMPRARQECANDPRSACCKSCGEDPGACPPDPTCKNAQGQVALLGPEEDDINLRCWDQKRRFGIDFLYPTDRYVQALTSVQIPNRAGELVQNPLFAQLAPQPGPVRVRQPGLVLFAGIVGVPWQDIARDWTDLKKGFKTAGELADPIDASGTTGWDVILGDPAKGVGPKDPLMVESVEKRSGTNPVTGDVLVDASAPADNPINGHEWTISSRDDLQYACVFPLFPAAQRDCSDMSQTACDCVDAANDNPLCAPNPNGGGAPTLQVQAKAYPGLRELEVLKEMGGQGIVASVCPAQLEQQGGDARDFGYRPAVGAVADRLTSALAGQCADPLPIDESGSVPCVVLEAYDAEGGACTCDAKDARMPVAAEHQDALKAAKSSPFAQQLGFDCFCEIEQLSGAERAACRTDPSDVVLVGGELVHGWCYVDPAQDSGAGAEVVAKCPEDEKRLVRFVGQGASRPGTSLAMICAETGSN